MQVGYRPKLSHYYLHGVLECSWFSIVECWYVRNHRLLCFHSINLIRCMHLSLSISKSIAIEKMTIKPLLTIDLEIWTSYLDLNVLESIPYKEEHVWIVWRSHIPKIFHPITWTTIMALQSVVFGRWLLLKKCYFVACN